MRILVFYAIYWQLALVLVPPLYFIKHSVSCYIYYMHMRMAALQNLRLLCNVFDIIIACEWLLAYMAHPWIAASACEHRYIEPHVEDTSEYSQYIII